MARSDYDRALDLVLVATKNLKAAMEVVAEDGAHTLPSADDAAKYARAAWREACENEAQVFDQMNQPPKPEKDDNQMDLLDPAPPAPAEPGEPGEPGDEAGGEHEERAAEEDGESTDVPLEAAAAGSPA